ncbi:MAG TPA: hypothetical protein VLF64_02625 [Candidatus Saccharimonadales bacterium]|nr:hypothetical protein [Candidatus Saccharimonadales bacterium]
MTNMPQLHRVTRIRGELALHPNITKVVEGFFEHPERAETGKLYTTAQLIVDQGDYQGRRYDRQLSDWERSMALKRMASQIFRIGPPLQLYEGSVMGRLQFSVHPDDKQGLTEFREHLAEIGGIEPVPADDMLYLELSRGALAKNAATRREQRDETLGKLASMLRHPTAATHLTATNLRMVTKDMTRRLMAEPDAA